ncbi:ABC transporter substrate-binding protein [uncultured Desulfobacter sp.]|uniref:ABC transporter substrate-binding protein n=1 Tax=uncultured Desulfobacter sp. TaxID=240139 RepID=UPI0029F51D44|nr:ABC transporter substrate-binding protein [uncultured Desulfobacter sp.]
MKKTTVPNTLSLKNSALNPIVLLILFGVLLYACGPEEPVRIGLITGTVGHMADVEITARYAIQMAVDQCNETGGIHGRRVELLVRDKQQNADDAVKDVKELIAQRIDAMIGPLSSSIALSILPSLNQYRMTTVSPTAISPLLAGRDDYFFRVCPSSKDLSRLTAEYQIRLGNMRHIAIAYHGGNPSFCEPFIEAFQNKFHADGGTIVTKIAFIPNEGRSFFQVAEALLREEPDSILIIANAMDSAILCQQIRKINSLVKITISSWGATQRFIELGGRAIEGVTLATAMDLNSPLPRYQEFRKNFLERYQHEPNIFNFYPYNAAQVVLTALKAQKKGQSLKAVLLSIGKFDGLQGKIIFDAYGDVKKAAFMRIIRDQKFAEPE